MAPIYIPPKHRSPNWQRHWSIRAVPYVLAFSAVCGIALSIVLFYLYMTTIK